MVLFLVFAIAYFLSVVIPEQSKVIAIVAIVLLLLLSGYLRVFP